MKRILKRIVCVIMALTVVMMCGAPAFAITPSEARNSVVWIKVPISGSSYSWGTGFAIGELDKPVSYIVTNAHVATIDGEIAPTIQVYFSEATNDFMKAQVYKIDIEKDVCVLKLPEPTEKRSALVVRKSAYIDLDDEYAALGFPGSSTTGMVMNFDKDDIVITRGGIAKHTTDDKNRDVYMIDVDMNHGNSGGPLINSKGEAVGIVSYYYKDSAQHSDANYAIAIDEVLSLIDRETVRYVLSTDVEASKSSSPVVLVIVIASAVVVAAAAIVIVMTMKKKKAAAPAAANAQQAAQPAPASVPAQSSNNAVVICEKGLLAGRTFPIGSGVIMGRDTQKCGICFPVDAKGISGVHCEIRKSARGFELIDRGSSYGTLMGNGQKLTPNVPVFIPDGTYFSLGSAEQLFQIKY